MLTQMITRNINQISALESAYKLVRDPNQLEEVLNLSDRMTELVRPGDLEAMARELEKDPQAMDAIKNRLRVSSMNHKRFAKYPKDSLGKAYYDHLTKSGISPEALTARAIRDDVDYIRTHFYETHDIWHTVTGFNIGVAGELGLAAFTAAQFPSHFNLVLLSGGLLNTALYKFDECNERMDAITVGWTMGRSARKFFGVEWDKLWKKPLKEVRAKLAVRMA